MDYKSLAAELLDIRMEWAQVPLNRRLSRLSRGELFVLNYLDTHGGFSYPKELSMEMQVSTARVAALLKHMEMKEWIGRSVSAQDNRQVVVELLEKGRAEIEQKREEALQDTAGLLEFLGEEDAVAFLRIQRKIIKEYLPD